MRFLVKAVGSPTAISIGLAGGPTVNLTTKPLFRSIGAGGGLGAAASATWHIVEADAPRANAAAAWDACHDLVAKGQGLASGGIRFAEPDLEQQWSTGKQSTADEKLALRTGAPNAQDSHYPRESDDYWFADNDHGQFSALGQADPGDGHRIRIAHLDTGFDPDHATCPKFIRGQKNFVDPDFPDDARDRSSGPFNNFSHGTGTLSILAGKGGAGVKAFGCAPNTEIVPIRVANRVILFRNSAIAQAFDHVHGLCRTPLSFVHVVTMSMGGVPSQAWAEAVNALYDAGVFVVTAAGNNYGNFPTHLIVYPARFNRVVAACGVMADGAPYADLSPTLMAGDYGPDSKMNGALAAYTPNVPWARFGEPGVVDFDGAGTSAATPQIAAAAATWIQTNRVLYEGVAEPWQRVELIRNALFESAAHDQTRAKYLGFGRLRAKDASTWMPHGRLEKRPEDDASFSLAHLVFGLAAAGPQKQPMLDLELCQVLQKSGLESKVAGRPNRGELGVVASEILGSPFASETLKRALRKVPVEVISAKSPAAVAHSAAMTPMDRLNVQLALEPPLPMPPVRKVRVFAYDPTLQTDPQMFGVNEATVSVPWEADLTEGPTGEYLEVVDVDPASQCCYAPVDLNHPHLLATNGHAPSEANPQFHQQMAYAVSMRTITRFERALGRRALWAARMIRGPDGNVVDHKFVQRLRIYPHALRENNSYYSSARMALLFGYFTAEEGDFGTSLPGSQVFCAVSHDIVAHETTHALLDGLHPRYQEATNPDMLAFHEAFADIVALFQHFTVPEALLQQIKRTRGDLSQESLLGQLAVQFGQASGMHGPLRSAIGRTVNGEWRPVKPSRKDYETQKATEDPHLLGSVLVSAVFAAFETIYRARSADLIRLATNGTGVLPLGEISHDLALRLAAEATTVADQVLNICIRALDYCPPTDLTFGEYLRALITGDRDLVRDDARGYRVAFISAFRDRGIFPKDVAHLAEDSLVWRRPPAIDADMASDFADLVKSLDLDWNLNSIRSKASETSEKNRLKVWNWISDPKRAALLSSLGFEKADDNVRIDDLVGEMRPVEVHSVRPSRKTAPDGTSHGWLVIGITQTFRAQPDAERYRGGCTVVVDLNDNMPVYFIRKCLRGSTGATTQQKARLAARERAAALGIPYVSPGDRHHAQEQFALLHRGWGA